MKLKELNLFLDKYKKFVFDSGVLLAYLQNENEKFTQVMDELVFSEKSNKVVFCHQLTLTELFYIHCRKHGVEKATILINDMKSMYEILKIDSLQFIAGKLKCQYPIALSDCFSIASGIEKNIPVLFLNEQELTKKIQKEIERDYKANIVIIECE
ncbi:MAG: PIN domain-containing protein [Promethearchaeota archaeon]